MNSLIELGFAAVVIASAMGLLSKKSRKRGGLRIRLTDGSINSTLSLDVERQLDEHALIRSTRQSQDFSGVFKNRKFVARVEQLRDGDDAPEESAIDDRGFWLQTEVAFPKFTRVSMVWDDDFVTTGDRDVATALATSVLRNFGRQGDSLHIRDGTIGYHGPSSWPRARFQNMFVLLTIIAERVEAVQGDVDLLLEQNFEADTDVRVRQESFLTLCRRWKRRPEWLNELLDTAITDEEIAIRIAAATKRGDVAYLRSIVLESDEVIGIRQYALRALLEILPDDERESQLRSLLESAEPKLCLVAVENFAQHGPASAITALDPVRPIFETLLALPTAEAIKAQPSAAALPHLLALAEQSSEWHAQKVAIEIIGLIGDVGLIPWLRELGFHEGTVETAVASIQSRARGGEGGLSVLASNNDAQGAVSSLPDMSGAVSKTPSDM